MFSFVGKDSLGMRQVELDLALQEITVLPLDSYPTVCQSSVVNQPGKSTMQVLLLAASSTRVRVSMPPKVLDVDKVPHFVCRLYVIKGKAWESYEESSMQSINAVYHHVSTSRLFK